MKVWIARGGDGGGGDYNLSGHSTEAAAKAAAKEAGSEWDYTYVQSLEIE